ncbi:MAG: tripartite tricarboxylate transporter permease [Rhodobacteraceae bacterium]|nr:tripartite tricarboxylate transporter permease [Paracoccaceae bacterium]
MIDLAAAGDAITLLSANPMAWLVVPLGLLIGLTFGVLPGLSVPIAMAVFLPFTLNMDFLSAILFLTAIFTGGGFGGSVPAILMNVPGTTAAIATCFDGYPMARKGRHNEALGLALAASTMGTIIGYALLFILLEPISRLVLKLGAPELFLVAVAGLFLIAALSGKFFWRGVLAGALGLMLGTMGMSSSGIMRGTAGSMYMLDGIAVTAAIIGLFAASEIFALVKSDYIVTDASARQVKLSLIAKGFTGAFKYWYLIARGGLIGAAVGSVPGVGSTVANLVSYSFAKSRSKTGDSFGEGNPEGVIAAESANSSSEGGSMVALLALGIPGGAGTAIMLGAFAMHNVTGGPRFVSDNKDVVYAIIGGNLVQAILLAGLGLLFLRIAVTIVKVPLRYLLPVITVLTVLGSYALSQNMVGPITLAAGALLGLVMKHFNYPVVAMVIGLLLGRMMEGNLLRTWQLGRGDLTIFFERPISVVLLIVLCLFAILPFVMNRANETPKRQG